MRRRISSLVFVSCFCLLVLLLAYCAYGGQCSITMNPGYGACEAFVSEPAADVVVIFEDTYSEWLDYSPPSYVAAYPSDRFAALIYNVPGADDAKLCVDLALARNIHYVYATDDGSDGNRWNDPPTYLSQLAYHLRLRDMSMLVPLYKYPDRDAPTLYFWQEIAFAAQQIPITAIINPHDGPGTGGPNSDYQYGMNLLAAAQVTMIGYLRAGYGSRSLQAVQADIDVYSNFWNSWLEGLFIDEVDGCNMTYWRDGIYNYDNNCIANVAVDPNPFPPPEGDGSIPRFYLSPPHPNPFNPKTVITFSASQLGEAQLAIYNLSGHCLVVLADEVFTPGEHQRQWDGNDAQGRPAASGLYLVRLQTRQSIEVRKVALMR